MKRSVLEKLKEIQEKTERQEVKILFICSGNIMRSPFAEFRARQLTEETSAVIEYSSGGVIYRNTSLSYETHKFLVGYGWHPEDLASFKPKHKGDYPEIFEEADVILVMENNHLNHLQEYETKSFLLTEFVGEEGEVLDPYFEGQIDEIYDQLNKLIIKLVDLITE